MRYLWFLPLLAACGKVTIGDLELTPAERCIAYTGAAARYERILEEEGQLNDAQTLAYDIALTGQAATCNLPPSS